MIDALYISASGLRSEQKQIDVISNNVANMHTPGFKRSRVNFVEVASAGVTAGIGTNGLGANPAAAQSGSVGHGTRIFSTATVFTAGDLRPTGNPLDLAIEGAGFFEFEDEAGNLVYSRDGQLRIDAEGQLVSVQGLRLARPVQIPTDASAVRIGVDGEVSALLSGDSERTVLGHIELAAFAAPGALAAIGDNRFRAESAAGAPLYGRPGDEGFGRVQQGYVETANVEMVEEMTALVMAQRAYQLNARVLQASDQILETINNLRR